MLITILVWSLKVIGAGVGQNIFMMLCLLNGYTSAFVTELALTD